MNHVQQLQNNNEDVAQAKELLKRHMLLTRQFFAEYRAIVAESKAGKAGHQLSSTFAQAAELGGGVSHPSQDHAAARRR